MNLHMANALGLALALLATAAPAADFSDPTWPCIQRKVDRLSVGLMWPAPLAEIKLDPETDRAVGELAETLVLRRVDLESADPEIAAFASAHDAGEAMMGEVFSRVFDRLSQRRSRIIDGIGKFSLGQIALSERIDSTRAEMEELMGRPEPDFDRIDALEEQVDWDQRIFTDRQRTITYLCETPQLLEKRLYALAQMLHRAGQDNGG